MGNGSFYRDHNIDYGFSPPANQVIVPDLTVNGRPDIIVSANAAVSEHVGGKTDTPG